MENSSWGSGREGVDPVILSRPAPVGMHVGMGSTLGAFCSFFESVKTPESSPAVIQLLCGPPGALKTERTQGLHPKGLCPERLLSPLMKYNIILELD